MNFRSPWSNTYDPPLEDGSMPSERLRKLEIDANHAFDQYRELYFEGGVSSVYLWDLDHGFAAVILIKKAGDGSKKIKGCWDSIHVVEVQEKSTGRTAHYKLTSTAMLWLQTNKHGSGTMNLGGSLTRQVSSSIRHVRSLNCTKFLLPLIYLEFNLQLEQIKIIISLTIAGGARCSDQRNIPSYCKHRQNGGRHGEQDP